LLRCPRFDALAPVAEKDAPLVAYDASSFRFPRIVSTVDEKADANLNKPSIARPTINPHTAPGMA
jgi:hypothetical protein